jgi:hypothetical protein
MPDSRAEALEELALAVGLLLDGPTDGSVNATDNVISAYDLVQSF